MEMEGTPRNLGGAAGAVRHQLQRHHELLREGAAMATCPALAGQDAGT